jgi:hypothetical protein
VGLWMGMCAPSAASITRRGESAACRRRGLGRTVGEGDVSSWAKEQTTRWWNGDVQQSCVHFTNTAIRRGATDEKAVGG